MLDQKSLLNFICDDILPSYDIDPAVGRNDPELADAVRAYLAAARPAVTVKPLAWSPFPSGGEQALAAGLALYRVHHNGDDWYLVPDHMGKGGKAAAQADYEQRILSALSAHPCTTSPVVDHETGNVDGKPNAVTDALADLLECWDTFEASYGNMENAYYNLAKYARPKWEAARTALTAALGAAGEPLADEISPYEWMAQEFERLAVLRKMWTALEVAAILRRYDIERTAAPQSGASHDE